ncbi:HemK2/MTQ2 family protein methyltransferase [Streptomyces sp. NPDC059913]|uniref:HemK2/MTQ2 family protein methyltransferase n=1 Tax=unclassified Streptomyces TaxID=2593676 RepID=UPI003656F189
MDAEADRTRTHAQPPFLVTLPGVYAPQSDTRLLLAALERERTGPGTHVLDIGTGSGALALRAAQLGCEVTAVDIALRAVVTARLNAMLHRRRITVRRSDLTSAVGARSFDLVLCNPPYVPAPGIPRHGAARAWNAGRDGRELIDRVCAGAPSVLRRGGGVLLMVHSGLCGAETTLGRLEHAGLNATISSRVRIPFGPVLLSRLRWLRDHRLLRHDDTNEELVVIRAERP